MSNDNVIPFKTNMNLKEILERTLGGKIEGYTLSVVMTATSKSSEYTEVFRDIHLESCDAYLALLGLAYTTIDDLKMEHEVMSDLEMEEWEDD